MTEMFVVTVEADGHELDKIAFRESYGAKINAERLSKNIVRWREIWAADYVTITIERQHFPEIPEPPARPPEKTGFYDVED